MTGCQLLITTYYYYYIFYLILSYVRISRTSTDLATPGKYKYDKTRKTNLNAYKKSSTRNVHKYKKTHTRFAATYGADFDLEFTGRFALMRQR